MSLKIRFSFLLFLCYINADAQEGCFGVSASIGFVEHGVFLAHDDKNLVEANKSRLLWPIEGNDSGLLNLGLLYYYKNTRFETNISLYPGFGIQERLPLNIGGGIFRFGNSFRLNPYSIKFLAYKNLNKKNDRISLNPGLGVSYYNLSVYDITPTRFKAFNPFNPNVLSYERLEFIHNKSNYQLIAALELAVRIGSYTYLSIKSQYHFGLFKMYERSYTYRYNQNQLVDHTASVLYYGNHYNINFGVRWRFNTVNRYNYID